MSIMFSILVPVYNVEAYLEECIESVIGQTYLDYELILVDDGSTDSSGAICDLYAKQKKQIRVYHQSNRGQLRARCFAIEHANGDYYVMLDSDDKLELNALSVLAETIERHECDCVFYNRKRLFGNGLVKDPIYHIPEGYLTDKRLIQRRALIEIPYNAIYLKCARAALFSNLDFSEYYYIKHGEDLLQSLELLRTCCSAEFIDDSLYIYRFRANSIVNTQKTVLEAVDLTVRKKALAFIEEEGLFTESDINDYRDKCIELFVDRIWTISSLSISDREKKDLFRTIRSDDYYTSFISKGISEKSSLNRKKRMIFKLFMSNMDDLVLHINKLYQKWHKPREQ